MTNLGFNNSFWAAEGAKLGVPASRLARVTAEHKGAYEVLNNDGPWRATVTGKRMLTASGRTDYPVVGDWVVLQTDDNPTKIITDILPRQTLLRKKHSGRDEAQPIAANIDVVFIVESLDGDFSPNRFERYLVLAEDSGARPIFILNKSDLLTDEALATTLVQLRQRFNGIEIITTSTTNNDGLAALKTAIQPGLTYCFVGSSGVGKSSIINQLIGQDEIKTKTISDKTGRGRHTTTARQIYFLSNGGVIIDNPGSREVGLVNTESSVTDVFAQISQLSAECKFSDCQHQNEPGCAVAAALASGAISQAQFANYQKLRQETAHYEMSAYDRRQKDRRFGQFLKQAKADLER